MWDVNVIINNTVMEDLLDESGDFDLTVLSPLPYTKLIA